jgi:large subunit ribosomal protein L22
MTEKNYNPEQRSKKPMKKMETTQKVKVKNKIIKDIEKDGKVPDKIVVKEEKIAEKVEKQDEVKKIQKPHIKKSEAIMNSYNLPISLKKSVAICKFIKGKTIEDSQRYLEQVVRIKKAIPMTGEIPHRKGNMMSGRFPVNTAKEFMLLLKSLLGNCTMNGLEDPIIVEAIANKAPAPYGRFGSWQRKRTHVRLVARDRKNKLKSIKK